MYFRNKLVSLHFNQSWRWNTSVLFWQLLTGLLRLLFNVTAVHWNIMRYDLLSLFWSVFCLLIVLWIYRSVNTFIQNGYKCRIFGIVSLNVRCLWHHESGEDVWQYLFWIMSGTLCFILVFKFIGNFYTVFIFFLKWKTHAEVCIIYKSFFYSVFFFCYLNCYSARSLVLFKPAVFMFELFLTWQSPDAVLKQTVSGFWNQTQQSPLCRWK